MSMSRAAGGYGVDAMKKFMDAETVKRPPYAAVSQAGKSRHAQTGLILHYLGPAWVWAASRGRPAVGASAPTDDRGPGEEITTPHHPISPR